MAVIERHRSILDRLFGRNQPVQRNTAVGHARTAAAISSNTTGVHASRSTKHEGRFWFALTAIVIMTVLGLIALYAITRPQGRTIAHPFDSKTVTDLLKVGSAVLAIIAALIARYLVQSLILTGLATAWTSLFSARKTKDDGAAAIKHKGGRFVGTFFGLLLIINVAMPLFHILTRKLGIVGFPGMGLVPVLAIGYLFWYRHGNHTTKSGT